MLMAYMNCIKDFNKNLHGKVIPRARPIGYRAGLANLIQNRFGMRQRAMMEDWFCVW